MSLIVIGSFVTDCVATCKKAPEAGQTVRGLSFNTYLGGKGANQAVAAKRMGSDVIMIGSIGNDAFGKSFINVFDKEGFDTKYINVSSKEPTGTSLVTVEESGQNRIVMTPGANLDYEADNLDAFKEEFMKASIAICQCEMKYSIIKKVAKMCKETNTKFILNPAPATKIDDEDLDGIYCITPNETELGILIGKEPTNLDEYIEGAKLLLKKNVGNVIVTLGSFGSVLVNKDGATVVEAYKIKAVDTVGAGDSFTGSLSAMIDQGYSVLEAMKIATAVAALEVQKEGAIPSMPYKKDVFEFINQRK